MNLFATIVSTVGFIAIFIGIFALLGNLVRLDREG